MATVESTTVVEIAEGSVSFTKPTGVEIDDFLLWIVACQDDNTIPTPSGWTVLANPLSSGTTNNVDTFVFYRVATSADVSASTYTIDVTDTTGQLGGIMMRISGVDTNTNVEGLSQGFDENQTTHSFTVSSTPTFSNSLLVLVGSGEGNDTSSSYTSTGSPTWTERLDITTPWADHLVVATAPYPSTTTITSIGYTTSTSTTREHGAIFIIRPQVNGNGALETDLINVSSQNVGTTSTSTATLDNGIIEVTSQPVTPTAVQFPVSVNNISKNNATGVDNISK